MKKFYCSVAAIILAGMLSGCFPSGETPISDKDIKDVSPEISDMVSENILPSENIPFEVPKINVKVMEWDTAVLNEMFLKEKDYLNHYEYPSDDFSNANYHAYMDERDSGDAYWLVYDQGRLTSEVRAKLNQYGYGTLMSSLETFDFGGYFDDESIEPFSISDAVDRASTVLKKLGVANLAEPNVYALTADKANKFLQAEYGDEYKKWTADDEIYILEYSQEYEGIPVTANFAAGGESGGHGSFFIGSRVAVVITKNEVLSINGKNLLSSEYSIGENVSLNCNSQKAIKIAAEYYNNLAFPGVDIKITDCKLVYVPFEQINEKEFTLIPMWMATAVLNYNDGRLINPCDYLFIDAQTGEIPIW